MSQFRPLTLQDYRSIARRRWLLIAVSAVVGLGIGYGGSLILPHRYTSQSLVLVQQQGVPKSFVQPVITEELNSRIAAIEGQALSRTRLQPIIERYNLFRNRRDVVTLAMDPVYRLLGTTEDFVSELQSTISISPLKPIITSTSSHDETPGFYLAVTLDDPRTAQQVCTDVASIFVLEDIRQRERSAQGTTTFLQSQLDDAKRKLDEEDAKLAAFKRRHLGTLPDDMQANINLLSALNTRLEAVTQALNRAEQDKTYAESVLAQQVSAWEIAKKPFRDAGPDPLEKRLEDLKGSLSKYESRYTSDHPDLIQTKAEIEDLKKQLHDSKASSDQKASKDAEAAKAAEPLEIRQLRAQVHAYDEAIRADKHAQQQLEDEIKDYQSRLQLSPVVEEEYKQLTRDYRTAQQFYNDLLGKRDQSGMTTDLERRQEGEQLSVMDPASLPEKPDFPNVPLFAAGGVGLGLALGLALAVALEKSRKHLRTEADIAFYFGQPAFALIPSITLIGNGKHARGREIGTNGEEKRKAPGLSILPGN